MQPSVCSPHLLAAPKLEENLKIKFDDGLDNFQFRNTGFLPFFVQSWVASRLLIYEMVSSTFTENNNRIP